MWSVHSWLKFSLQIFLEIERRFEHKPCKFLPEVFPKTALIVDSDLLPVFVVCESGLGLSDVLVCQLIQVIQLPGELQSLTSQLIDSFRENIKYP